MVHGGSRGDRSTQRVGGLSTAKPIMFGPYRDGFPPAFAGVNPSYRLTGQPLTSAPAAAPGVRTGRNDPCPCGSGRKFKQCCGAGRPAAAAVAPPRGARPDRPKLGPLSEAGKLREPVAGARQPVYSTSIARWRRYEPWLGELRELLPPTEDER
jgi:hypothetical protein